MERDARIGLRLPLGLRRALEVEARRELRTVSGMWLKILAERFPGAGMGADEGHRDSAGAAEDADRLRSAGRSGGTRTGRDALGAATDESPNQRRGSGQRGAGRGNRPPRRVK